MTDLRLGRTGDLVAEGDLRGQAPAPALKPEEKEAEENCAAGIDPDGVAQLVTDAGIILRVDGDIASHEEVGHGARHHRAVKHPLGKTSGIMSAIDALSGAAEQPADRPRHYHHQGNPAEERSVEERDFPLFVSVGLRKEKHVFQPSCRASRIF